VHTTPSHQEALRSSPLLREAAPPTLPCRTCRHLLRRGRFRLLQLPPWLRANLSYRTSSTVTRRLAVRPRLQAGTSLSALRHLRHLRHRCHVALLGNGRPPAGPQPQPGQAPAPLIPNQAAAEAYLSALGMDRVAPRRRDRRRHHHHRLRHQHHWPRHQHQHCRCRPKVGDRRHPTRFLPPATVHQVQRERVLADTHERRATALRHRLRRTAALRVHRPPPATGGTYAASADEASKRKATLRSITESSTSASATSHAICATRGLLSAGRLVVCLLHAHITRTNLV
jgi:hypothetical protein